MSHTKAEFHKISGFKGFDLNLRCRDFQFAIGKTYKTADAKVCETSFHLCEDPFDVLNYYPPAESRFAAVEGAGKTDKHNSDSKVACTQLKVCAEIGLSGLISAGVRFILDKVSWENDKKTNTGNRSAATNTGDHSAATNTGYQSAATVEGKQSIACGLGIQSKARGKKTCWLVLAEWHHVNNNWEIKVVKSVLVDGEIIKEDTWYKLEAGEFIEVADNQN